MINMYADELDTLYADAEKLQYAHDGFAKHRPQDLESLAALIRRSTLNFTGWTTFADHANLFILGMDSLQTLLLTRNLRQAMAISAIAPSTVYTNPSVTQLAKAIMDLSVQNQSSLAARQESRKQDINDLLTEHQLLIDELAASMVVKKSSTSARKGHTVLLTGSTGALGSYLLHHHRHRDERLARQLQNPTHSVQPKTLQRHQRCQIRFTRIPRPFCPLHLLNQLRALLQREPHP
jgi:aryl carrier-like protein